MVVDSMVGSLARVKLAKVFHIPEEEPILVLLEQAEQAELIIQVILVLMVLVMEQVAVVKDKPGVAVLQLADMAVIRVRFIQLHILFQTLHII
jgi:hypothetical protein